MNEPNPIYWLESRQGGSGCLQAFLILAGIAMALFLCLAGIANHFDPALSWFFAIPLAFYALGPLIVPADGTRRLMEQQLDGDLILQVPMTPREILWGKLQTTLNHLVCLYGPTLPGVLLCLVAGQSGMAVGVFIGFCVTLSLSLVGYGFAAGCRTPLLRGTMLVLGGLFAFSLFPIFWMVAFFVDWVHRAGPISFHASESYVFFCASLFLLVASFLIYGMGVLIFRPNRALPEILLVLAGLAGGAFVLTGIVILYLNVHFESLVLLVPWTAFYGAPLLAMLAIVVNDRTRGRIVY